MSRHKCEHYGMDEYQCQDEGTIRVGTKWYCSKHIESDVYEDGFENEFDNMFDDEIDDSIVYKMADF